MTTKYRANYHIINSVAGPIGKHNVSAAGPVGFQHFTPILDTELLLYGRPITAMPPQVNPNLDTGSVSPMMPVRALLKELQDAERHVVHINALNLGIPPVSTRPHFDPTLTDDGYDTDTFASTLTSLPLPTHNAEPPFWDPQPAHLRTISQAAFQLAFQLYTKTTPTDWNILAECVPGGTTTAGLWLSMAAGKPITTPSSSHLTDPNTRKTELIEHWFTTAQRQFPSLDTPEALWGFALAHGDYYQIFILAFLYEYADLLKHGCSGTARNPILLAGGSQAAAPLALFRRVNPRGAALLAPHIKLVTTPWIMKSSDPRIFNELINPFVSDAHYDFAFRSSDGPYHLYEHGYTKEGCGLGAVLWYATTVHGISDSTIRYWCRNILATFNRQTSQVAERAPTQPLTHLPAANTLTI